MKKLFCLIPLFVFMLAVTAMAADPDVTAIAIPVVATADAATTIAAWLMASLGPIFAILLAISELMSVSPWFKGNGIVDTICKALRFLVDTNAKSASPTQ